MYCLNYTIGEPNPPTDLVVTLPTQGLVIALSWTPGPAVQGEEVTFVIVSKEVSSGITTESATNIPSAMLLPTTSVPACQNFNFTIHSVNGFGRSGIGVSEVKLLPSGMFAS